LELKTFGCKVALDDFGADGSNYSRFLGAGWWPDDIKIDGSFIRNLDADGDRRKIVRAMVRSAEELGCAVVAEYVENEAIFRAVRDMGIRYSQGYFFHKPEPMPENGSLPTRFELPN
jgi:EAL domain-containing protein (putative c-di-GMP-specific phosphodiesterase class I)